MPQVSVYVDASDIADEMSAEELQSLLDRKRGHTDDDNDLLLRRVYEHFKISGGAPECLRDYIWKTIGKVL